MEMEKALTAWYKTPQGEVVRGLIATRITALWPFTKGAQVLIIGYDQPYKSCFSKSATVKTLTALRASQNIPFEAKYFDYILVIHTLEHAPNTAEILAECERCLVPSGKVLVVAPNRLGHWARAEKTPFGCGQPFTAVFLSSALTTAGLMPTYTDMTAFLPPINRPTILNAVHAFEKLGRFFALFGTVFGGILLVEGTKQVVGGMPVSTAKKRKKTPRFRPAFGACKRGT